MKDVIRTALLAVMLTCGIAIADDAEVSKEIEIVVASDGKEINWTSAGADLDLDSLAVGESRTVENENGETITATRTDEGISFEIDGETIMVPDVGGHEAHMAFAGHAGMHESIDVRLVRMDGDGEDADVHVMGHDAVAIQAHHPDGVTIISGSPLDDSVRESIRSVLISAGHDDEVTFIDGSGDGERRVRVIKKKVVTQ